MWIGWSLGGRVEVRVWVRRRMKATYRLPIFSLQRCGLLTLRSAEDDLRGQNVVAFLPRSKSINIESRALKNWEWALGTSLALRDASVCLEPCKLN